MNDKTNHFERNDTNKHNEVHLLDYVSTICTHGRSRKLIQ